MASTWPKRALGVVQDNPFLSLATRWEPEGASQTFTKGSPVIFSSGLLVASTDPIESDSANYLSGIALEDGHNAAAGPTNLCKFVPARGFGFVFYANWMTGDGSDNTWAAADLNDIGGSALSSKSGFVVSGRTDWFLDDADANGCTVVSTKADIILPNVENGYRVAVGDTNPRVGFVFLDTVVNYGYRIAS